MTDAPETDASSLAPVSGACVVGITVTSHVHTQPSGGHRRGETVLAATVPPVPPSKNWRILLVESSTHDLADGNQ